MTHKTRNTQAVERFLRIQGLEFEKSVDTTDFYRSKVRQLRMVGIQQNFINILQKFLETDGKVCVVLQDDIAPVSQFGEVVPKICEAIPQDIVLCGFVVKYQQGWGKKWEKAGKPTLFPMPKKYSSGLCVFIPRKVAEGFMQMVERELTDKPFLSNKEGEPTGDDQALAEYCNEEGIPMYAIMPNLVEHIGYNSVWGMSWNYKGIERTAYEFDKNYDYSKINWREELAKCLR